MFVEDDFYNDAAFGFNFETNDKKSKLGVEDKILSANNLQKESIKNKLYRNNGSNKEISVKQASDSENEDDVPINRAKNNKRRVVFSDDENDDEENFNIINVNKRRVVSEDEDSILGDITDFTKENYDSEKPKNNYEMDEDDVMDYLKII